MRAIGRYSRDLEEYSRILGDFKKKYGSHGCKGLSVQSTPVKIRLQTKDYGLLREIGFCVVKISVLFKSYRDITYVYIIYVCIIF